MLLPRAGASFAGHPLKCPPTPPQRNALQGGFNPQATRMPQIIFFFRVFRHLTTDSLWDCWHEISMGVTWLDIFEASTTPASLG
uniref:Uncharacterized protein n=1 Tax=Calidris pygmaea TaxID=425635 RepID=A0A8C3KC82_9CHAR